MPQHTKPSARTVHRLREVAASKGKSYHALLATGSRGKWRGRGTPGAFGNPVKSENFAYWENAQAQNRVELEDAQAAFEQRQKAQAQMAAANAHRTNGQA